MTGRSLISTALSKAHLSLRLTGPLYSPLILNKALCLYFMCMNSITYTTDLGQTKAEVVVVIAHPPTRYFRAKVLDVFYKSLRFKINFKPENKKVLEYVIT